MFTATLPSRHRTPYASPSMAEHRKRRKSFDIEGHIHAFTFSCYRRLPFLESDFAKRVFLDCLQDARERHGFLVWAYVVMPEHVHLLIPPRGVPVAKILKSIKQPVTQRMVAHLKRTDPSALLPMISGMKRGHSPYSFWQGGGGYDDNLKTSDEVWRMIEYIHLNPVRRGLVQDASDWRWSSCRFYRNLAPYEFEVDRCEE